MHDFVIFYIFFIHFKVPKSILQDGLRQDCIPLELASHPHLPVAKAFVLHLQQDEKDYSAPIASEDQSVTNLQIFVQAVEQSTIELASVLENSLIRGAPGESASATPKQDPDLVAAVLAAQKVEEINNLLPKARKKQIKLLSNSNPNSPKIQQNISADQLNIQAQNKR